MAQTTFYPCKTVKDACLTCYSGESSNCKPKYGSKQNSKDCVDNCNSKCQTIQAYCQIGVENITAHADTPSWSGFPNSEVIQYRWTAQAWNDLQRILKTAGTLGQIDPVGEPSFTNACSLEVITSGYYNEWSTAAEKFRTSVPQVNSEDVIREAHSAAITNLLPNAKFKTSTCDICNASTQYICSYDCSCNYNCSYNCDYDCDYDCYYDCDHDCTGYTPPESE